MSDTLEQSTETFYPVLDFRWFHPKPIPLMNGCENEFFYPPRLLQQKYLSNTGKEKWVSIPSVQEE